MRIAVIGKGGAGKSVIAGTLARLAARAGADVLAMDFDLATGLSLSLGSGPDPSEPPLLLSAEQDSSGQWGWRAGLDVASAAQRFSTVAPDGVRLLQRGKLARDGFAPLVGASKAFCQITRRIGDTAQFRDWTLIGDLPAGPRLIAEQWSPYARTYLVVVHPSAQSVLAARRVARVARLQVPAAEIVFVANRVESESDVRYLEQSLGERVLASVPADQDVTAAERLGVAPLDHAPDAPAIAAIRGLLAALERAR